MGDNLPAVQLGRGTAPPTVAPVVPGAEFAPTAVDCPDGVTMLVGIDVYHGQTASTIAVVNSFDTQATKLYSQVRTFILITSILKT